MVAVRDLRTEDWEAWKPLWDGYLHFYREPLPDPVTEATFRRMCERTDGMLALVAENDEGALVGFAHVVIHPSTWTATQIWLRSPATPRRRRTCIGWPRSCAPVAGASFWADRTSPPCLRMPCATPTRW